MNPLANSTWIRPTIKCGLKYDAESAFGRDGDLQWNLIDAALRTKQGSDRLHAAARPGDLDGSQQRWP